jgi:hypothetical protein
MKSVIHFIDCLVKVDKCLTKRYPEPGEFRFIWDDPDYDPTIPPHQTDSKLDPTQAPAQTHPVFEPTQAQNPVFDSTQAQNPAFDPTQAPDAFKPTSTEAYSDPYSYPYHLPQSALETLPPLTDPIDQERRNAAILFIEDLVSYPHPPNLLDIQRLASAHRRDFKRLYPHADLDLIHQAEILLPFIDDHRHAHLRRLFTHLRTEPHG